MEEDENVRTVTERERGSVAMWWLEQEWPPQAPVFECLVISELSYLTGIRRRFWLEEMSLGVGFWVYKCSS